MAGFLQGLIYSAIVLAVLGFIWLIAIPEVFRATTQLTGRKKIWLRVLTVVSLPIFVASVIWYPSLHREWDYIMYKWIVRDSYGAYLQLCASLPSIDVKKTVNESSPVDIQIVDDPWGLKVLEPGEEQSVCWLDGLNSRCAMSNVGNVESKFRSRDWGCEVAKPPKECNWHYYRYDRKAKRRLAVDGHKGRFALVVSEGQEVLRMVQRFDLGVRDLQTNETLASTHLFRRSNWSNSDLTPQELTRAPYICPNRDLHIADLLSKVFPVPVKQGNGQSTSSK